MRLQTTQPPAHTRLALRAVAWAGAAMLAGTAARAQDAGGLTITPTFTAQELLTTNRDLSSTPQADLVTTLSPGVRITSHAGRIQGSLTFALNMLNYARDSQLNSITVQNALDTAFRIDTLENRAFVDVAANVSQQTISAYGTQAAGTGLVNGNRTEVSTLSVAPGVRGNLNDLVQYNGSVSWVDTRSKSTQLGDSTGYGGQFGLSGRLAMVGWGVNVSRQGNSFTEGSTTATDQIVGSLSYAPRYDLKLSVNLGRSRSNVLTGAPFSSTTSGWGLNWQPTERTNISLQGGRTYYGSSHSYVFTHRMARSVWSYLDSNAVSTPGPQAGTQPLTLYDLFLAICESQGGDATSCDAQVRATIAQQGLNPGTVVSGGFLNSTLTVAHSQTLSASYSGQRMTTTLSVFRSTTSGLGVVAPGVGDLSNGAPVRQQGATLGVSHQLTPTAALTLTGSQLSTLDSGAQPGTRQRIATLAWTFIPASRINLTLTARHTQFVSTTSPYTESAVLASMSYRF